MEKVAIRTTRAQRERLETLKARFGEWGYYIYDVASWYRRHRLDFVALPKMEINRGKILVVRPGKGGVISVRPFQRPGDYFHLKTKLISLAEKKPELMIRWSNRRLPYAQQRPDWWDQYVAPADYAKLELLSDTTIERSSAKPGT